MAVLPTPFRICDYLNRFPFSQNLTYGSGRYIETAPHPKQDCGKRQHSAFLLPILVLLLTVFLSRETVHAEIDAIGWCSTGGHFASGVAGACYWKNDDSETKILLIKNDSSGTVIQMKDNTSTYSMCNTGSDENPPSGFTSVVIGDGIANIGNDVFHSCDSLTSAEISDSVKSIGQYAFAGCSKLENLIISPKVEKIGEGAFSGIKGPVYAPASALPVEPGNVTGGIVRYSALTLTTQAANMTTVTLQSETALPEDIIETINSEEYTYYFITDSKVGLTVKPGNDFVRVSAVDSDSKSQSLTRNGGVFSLTMPESDVTFSTEKVSLSVDSLTYNGEDRTDDVIVKKSDGTTLTKGTDYTISFKQGGTEITPKAAGEYTAVIIGAGSYIGTASVSFSINKADSYLVHFAPNGGSGNMSDQVIPVNTDQTLSANVYTRDGFTFTGWNTAENGSGIAYADGQNVKDLAAAGKTVTLYAQWTKNSKPEEKMELDVKFVNVKADGKYGVPGNVKALTLTPRILIKDDSGTVSRSLDPVSLEIKPGDTEPIVKKKVVFTPKIKLESGLRVTVTGLPSEVPVDIFDSDGKDLTEKLVVQEARPNNEGGITVTLIWGTGDWTPEVIPVYALPEDEIGAYVLLNDGTKEYLIFQTYDICMAYLGSDELCSGPEKCFHK